MIDNPPTDMNGFRVMSRGDLRRELESFNNCYFTHIEGSWMYFKATPFAAHGIITQLGREVYKLLGRENEYRINMSNNPINHQ
jgi:hypothetical protein